MKLVIPCGDPVEAELASKGIRAYCQAQGVEPDGFVYGCGEMVPGKGLSELAAALASGKLRGIVGLTVSEKSVTAYGDQIRAAIGQVLQLAPQAWVGDALSSEWSLHYAFHSKVGGHPAWLTPGAKRLVEPREVIVTTVAQAIVAVLVGAPCVFYCEAGAWGNIQGRGAVYHPLRRFAELHGLEGRVAESKDEAQALLLKVEPVSRGVVKRAQAEARRTLAALGYGQQAADPMAALDDMLSGGGGPVGADLIGASPSPSESASPDAPRECRIGSVFDPATHYTGHYYDGRGLLYTMPDGRKQIYHGTGLHWEGYGPIAKMIEAVVPCLTGKDWGLRPWRPIGLLDIGCSNGDFLKQFKENNPGWLVYGVDISDEAIDRAAPEIRTRLFTGDVAQPDKGYLFTNSPYHLITSWDLLEHIWEKDIESFLRGVYDLLTPGGIFWNNVCTRGDREQDFVAQPGVQFTRENSWALISGHVNIRTWEYWIDKLFDAGFEPEYELMTRFQVRMSEHPELRRADSWRARNCVIVRKR